MSRQPNRIDWQSGASSTNDLSDRIGRVCAAIDDLFDDLYNDPRLSDARTPKAHASTHQSGGSDPLMLDLNVIRNGTGPANQAIATGYSAYAPGKYEISGGYRLEIAAAACLEIG